MVRFILIIIILASCKTFSWAQVDSSKTISAALSYLTSNKKKIKKEWYKILSPGEKKLYRQKNRNVAFYISKNVCYYDMIAFSRLAADSANGIHVPSELFDEFGNIVPSKYSNLYNFNSYSSEIIRCPICRDSIENQTGNAFSINFSKPVNNYLIAVMSTLKEKLQNCNAKMQGKVLLILFLYDNNSNLKKVYFSWDRFE